MANSGEFRPDWASAPGDTILDILRERHVSTAEFAKRIGQSVDSTRNLLQGRTTITIALARSLERELGASVEFWMSRDFQYREQAPALSAEERDWLEQLPVGDMVRFGWLKPAPQPSEEKTACLRFFDVSDIQAWQHKYARMQEMAVFRTSRSFDSRAAAVAAWLRQGEIESERITSQKWDPGLFRRSLTEARQLTREKIPSRFIPRLQTLCADAGVAVVIVRAPSGCRASGATLFPSPRKALLLLSFRYLTDDQFWFSFFHEAAHLLIHGVHGFFLEGMEARSTKEEDEANQLAERILIPAEFKQAMLRLPVDGRQVVRFARRVGVSPGIIVGQLQHYRVITYRQLSNLKRRFVWEE